MSLICQRLRFKIMLPTEYKLNLCLFTSRTMKFHTWNISNATIILSSPIWSNKSRNSLKKTNPSVSSWIIAWLSFSLVVLASFIHTQDSNMGTALLCVTKFHYSEFATKTIMGNLIFLKEFSWTRQRKDLVGCNWIQHAQNFTK